MKRETKDSLMVATIWLLVVLSATMLLLSGCKPAPRPEPVQPYSYGLTAEGWRWFRNNVDSYDGWSLTGWSRTKLQFEMWHISDPWNLHLKRASRLKVGVVPIREPVPYATYEEKNEDYGLIGIGLDVQF